MYLDGCENNIKYLKAIKYMSFDNQINLERAKKIFVELNGFKDSNAKIYVVDKRIKALNKRKYVEAVFVILFFMFVIFLFMYCTG